VPKLRKHKTKFSGLVRRLGRRNLAVVVAFVLVFAGAGTLYVQRSLADASAGYCVYYKLYEYRPGFYGSQCVKDVEFALTRLGNGPYNLCTSNYCDGIFGPETYADVLHFGYVAGIPGGNGGQVGTRTWQALCVRSYEYPSVAINMGCNKPDQYWGTL